MNIENIVNDVNISKSEKIRKLYENGLTIANIAKILNINYSFAYQTVSKYCEKANIPKITKDPKDSKAAKIRELFENGENIGNIAKSLNSNYCYVWNICNKTRNK